jgi:hypothetical protein
MTTMNTQPLADVRFLSPTDRCDRCGAAGYVLAVLLAADLVFCAHHGREYAERLAQAAVLVVDESHQLQAA